MPELKLAAESEEQRIVWAEVYVPGIPDSDGEHMDAVSIREMAYKFLRDKKVSQIDVQHTNKLVPGASVVESFISRKGDDTFPIPGSWVVGIHVPDDETWSAIKSGKINGLSIEAFVTKTNSEVEIDIPPVLEGLTSKADDGHSHRFYVSYDADGNFLGGVTDEAKGHKHTIKKGTVTDTVSEHNHRFSHIELLVPQEV
jgi:hypothetical protein